MYGKMYEMRTTRTEREISIRMRYSKLFFSDSNAKWHQNERKLLKSIFNVSAQCDFSLVHFSRSLGVDKFSVLFVFVHIYLVVISETSQRIARKEKKKSRT